MGTHDGPGGEGASPPPVLIERIFEEFKALKTGDGLSPQKMASARGILRVMGEVYPIAATQRLLDDLGDLDNDEGRALAWALKADPAVHIGSTLDARRAASHVPENTAKDRERRAVLALFDIWIRRREDWASSVFTIRAVVLPIVAKVRFGSLSIRVQVFRDEHEDLPVVFFELDGPYPSHDFLTLANNANQALVVYGTAGLDWRLELWLPSLGNGAIRVARNHQGRRPVMVRLEQSLPDGRATEERLPGENFNGETIITMRSPNLDPPCPITWDWVEPEQERRPAIVFPEDAIDDF